VRKIPPGISHIAEEAGRVARYLWERGWAERNAGNISIDVTDVFGSSTFRLKGVDRFPLTDSYGELAGRIFLVKNHGARMREVAAHPDEHLSIVALDSTGRSFEKIWSVLHDAAPTMEFNSHLAIHRLLQVNHLSEKVVLHTHPTELIALSHIMNFNSEDVLNRMLWSMHPEAKVVLPEGVGLVKYRIPGSQELETLTARAFRTHKMALWEKHGAVAVGEDPEQAFDYIDTVNKCATVYLHCLCAGTKPQGLTSSQIDELSRVFCGDTEKK
jgi:rhamnulose-1-phosphate aldolase